MIYTFVLSRGKCEVSDEYLQTNRGLMMQAHHLRTDDARHATFAINMCSLVSLSTKRQHHA